MLCANLLYSTEDGKFAYNDYFQTLADAIDAIPKLELENDVAPGTETAYAIELTQSAEQIVDECDRIFRRLNQFEGKLKEAERKINNQRAEFVAWYMLAAITLFRDLEDVKLPMAETRKLGEAEFSRLMGGLDVAVLTLIDALKIEAGKVSQHKAAQKEKYNLGRDQANATWASTLPAFGNAVSSERPGTSGVQEMDEDLPEPIRAYPPIGDTLRIIKPQEDGIKGTFTKTGDPQPVVPVGEYSVESIKVLEGLPKRVSEGHTLFPDGTPNPPVSPRKRLILDDDEAV